MARGARACAATFRIDAWHVVADRTLHQTYTGTNLDNMLLPIMFKKRNLDHVTVPFHFA
jgi:hypothetical protein